MLGFIHSGGVWIVETERRLPSDLAYVVQQWAGRRLVKGRRGEAEQAYTQLRLLISKNIRGGRLSKALLEAG